MRIPAAGRRRRAALLLLALPVLGLAAEPLTLDTAIQTALRHNRSLAYGALGVERQRLDEVAAGQEFDPEISPYGQVTAVDGDTDWRYGMRAEKRLLWGTEIGLGAEVHRYPPFVDDAWRSAVKVDVRQPLFRRFGTLVTGEPLTAAGDRLRAERRRWESRKADLVVEVVGTFETVIRLQKQIACDQSILDRIGRLRELTRLRERQGRASRVDTLRDDLQWGQAEARLEAHREESFSTRRALAELLGWPPETEADLVEPPLPDLDVPAMETAVGNALSNRLDYAQVIDDYFTARRQERLARRGLLPDLDVVAENQQYERAARFRESTELDRNLWSVGIAGQMGLLKRPEKTAVARAQVDVQAARELVQVKAVSVAREVQQAVSAYRQARAEFAIAGRNYEAAQARAELARRLFEMGRGDNFAVTDAENAWIESEASLLSTRSRVCLTGYELLARMGTLTEVPETLKPKPMEPAP